MYENQVILNIIRQIDSYFCEVNQHLKLSASRLNIKNIQKIKQKTIMKKILSILIIMVLGLSIDTFAAVNNDLADKGKRKKGRNNASSKAEFAQIVVEDEPIDFYSLASDITSADNKVTVKVFDITGKVVMEKQVKIESFLNSKSRMDELTGKSVFVMYHQNTAYYFLEKGV
jgi:hypothetical protein